MFASNMANRLWKQMFNLGLVDPVDQLDPLRLDPNNAPPAPWDFQATHPVLMEKLASRCVNPVLTCEPSCSCWRNRRRINLAPATRAIGTIHGAAVCAPLSSPFGRRRDSRRDHPGDADFNKYTVQGFADPFASALSLPDPVEPRSNGTVAAFMNSFLRGNRDTTFRSEANSILQQLNIMNDAFVTGRTQVAKSPELLAISKIADNGAAVDELCLAFLSRHPTDYERSKAVAYLAKDHVRGGSQYGDRRPGLGRDQQA